MTVVTPEMNIIQKILFNSTKSGSPYYFGGCIRDILREITPTDLDVFIYVPVPTRQNIANVLEKILSHKDTQSFSLNGKAENVLCYAGTGFTRYPIILNGVNVDLVFSNASIANNWGRRPDADVNLLYSRELSFPYLKVMENTCGATVSSILRNLFTDKCVFEEGITEKRKEKILSKGFELKSGK